MRKIKILAVISLIPLLGTIGFGISKDSVNRDVEYCRIGDLITINIGGNFVTLPLVNFRGYANGQLLERGMANGSILSREVANGQIYRENVPIQNILSRGEMNGQILSRGIANADILSRGEANGAILSRIIVLSGIGLPIPEDGARTYLDILYGIELPINNDGL
ncbi:MAG: hypothetical protein HY606_07530 [Planctomycetes bacterium]|nr:hypothetical protein [Planctomycetota bacterium]